MIMVMIANRRNCFRNFTNAKESSAEKNVGIPCGRIERSSISAAKSPRFLLKAHNELIDKLDSRPVTRFDLREMFWRRRPNYEYPGRDWTSNEQIFATTVISSAATTTAQF
jgi:hypothetical protein